VRRGGYHLKHAPPNNCVSLQHDRCCSRTQGDAATTTQQVTEVRTHEEAVRAFARDVI
jgi:hypothetical protein